MENRGTIIGDGYDTEWKPWLDAALEEAQIGLREGGFQLALF